MPPLTFKLKILFIIFILGTSSITFASTTNGTIDSTNAYAYGENVGWINFGTSQGAVTVADTALTGYGWGENVGWISLNCSNTSSCATVNYAVSNDNQGTLSGYAYGENVGWISFNCSNTSSCATVNYGVTINSSGNFSGYAYGENVGWISFNCSNTSSCATVNYYVLTDWRPASTRSSGSTSGAGSNSGGGGGGFGSALPPPPSTIAPSRIIPPQTEAARTPAPVPPAKSPSLFQRIKERIAPLIPSFLKPPQAPAAPPPPAVPTVAPPSFGGKWCLLPCAAIYRFALSPLPREFVSLAKKFPELQKTFGAIGIAKITDVQKIKNATFTLPGLTKAAGVLKPEKIIGGRFVIPAGIPIDALPKDVKEKIPSEVLFAKTGGNLIDFDIALSVRSTGAPEQRIETISGAPLQLVVKPEKPAERVMGYIVFRSRATIPATSAIRRSNLFASLVFSLPSFAKPAEAAQYLPIEGGTVPDAVSPAPQKQIEHRLVLREFEYTDPDGDGIYTANVQVPVPAGEYDVITLITYKDPELGTREIILTTVVDPEGYVYEKSGGKETRIPGATVSIYWFDPAIKGYELWPADQYAQENPQTTDIRGTYSFLVPEGKYYLKASAPGYGDYSGKEFEVQAGSGVHQNIELAPRYTWIPGLDVKTTVLLIVILFLLYNFYRDKMRERALQNELTPKK